MHFIRPSDADPAITNYDAFHIALASTIPRGRLLVFLPGTGGSPSTYQEILRTGASNGLHAIGLQYVNGETVSAICGGDSDTNTHAKVREEIIWGTNTSTLIDVDVPNSIEGRLISLLRHLTNAYPAEAWAQYLGTSNDLVWSNIVAAGHSQGASHAAFIGKKRRLNRVVAIGNEADWITGLGPAPWFSWPPETPVSRFLCFTHTNDMLLMQSATWNALGITGTNVGVEFNDIPFQESHRLTTGLKPAVGTNWLAYHSAPVVDLYTPRTNGVPILQYVWEWLLVGAVTVPQFSRTEPAGSGFEVTFHAEHDVTYHIQTTTNLAASWELSGQIVTNLSGQIAVSLTNESSIAFYRILVEWK